MVIEVDIVFLLILLVSAVLSIQIADESTLALDVKRFFGLQSPFNEYNKTFKHLGRLRTWWKMVGSIFWILFPVFAVIVLIFRVHRFISNLLECSRCTSVWIFGLLLYFVYGLIWWQAVLFAPLSIIGVYVIEKIRE